MNPVIDTAGRIGAGFLLICLGCFLLLHLGKGLAAAWRWIAGLEIDWANVGFIIVFLVVGVCALVLALGICWLVGSVAFVFLGVV